MCPLHLHFFCTHELRDDLPQRLDLIRVFQERWKMMMLMKTCVASGGSIIANGLLLLFLGRILATWRPKIRVGGGVLQTDQRIFFRGKRAHSRHI
jgi:hypothetical protein